MSDETVLSNPILSVREYDRLVTEMIEGVGRKGWAERTAHSRRLLKEHDDALRAWHSVVPQETEAG